MQEIISKISTIEHGFKPIEFEAKKLFNSNSIENSMALANELLENDIHQVRCLAVFLLGYAASKDVNALQVLKTKISTDKSWQVQEILAKSFDRFCQDTGYENSLPGIKNWLNDPNPNVCRAVTEGLRIWTNRPFFRTNPEIAIRLISQHKSCDSEYLRKSVGNSLRDISRKHEELIDRELSTWDITDKRIHFTYKLVMKNRK